jgi:adenine/guanine phosphoribosyltransferase-like PRPP-binding protein
MAPLKAGTVYFDHAFADLGSIERRAREAGLHKRKFDTFIGRGLSGALMAPVLGRMFDKHFAVVRKPKDGSHSGSVLEGYLGQRWVFVDDFISTGATIAETHKIVHQYARARRHSIQFGGAYLYEKTCGSWRSRQQCARYIGRKYID